jgi:hypothetical protein
MRMLLLAEGQLHTSRPNGGEDTTVDEQIAVGHERAVGSDLDRGLSGPSL